MATFLTFNGDAKMGITPTLFPEIWLFMTVSVLKHHTIIHFWDLFTNINKIIIRIYIYMIILILKLQT